MWISKKKYQEMFDKIDQQSKVIEIYRSDIKRLEDANYIMTKHLMSSPYGYTSLDFPNSSKEHISSIDKFI